MNKFTQKVKQFQLTNILREGGRRFDVLNLSGSDAIMLNSIDMHDKMVEHFRKYVWGLITRQDFLQEIQMELATHTDLKTIGDDVMEKGI